MLTRIRWSVLAGRAFRRLGPCVASTPHLTSPHCASASSTTASFEGSTRVPRGATSEVNIRRVTSSSPHQTTYQRDKNRLLDFCEKALDNSIDVKVRRRSLSSHLAGYIESLHLDSPATASSLAAIHDCMEMILPIALRLDKAFFDKSPGLRAAFQRSIDVWSGEYSFGGAPTRHRSAKEQLDSVRWMLRAYLVPRDKVWQDITDAVTLTLRTVNAGNNRRAWNEPVMTTAVRDLQSFLSVCSSLPRGGAPSAEVSAKYLSMLKAAKPALDATVLFFRHHARDVVHNNDQVIQLLTALASLSSTANYGDTSRRISARFRMEKASVSAREMAMLLGCSCHVDLRTDLVVEALRRLSEDPSALKELAVDDLVKIAKAITHLVANRRRVGTRTAYDDVTATTRGIDSGSGGDPRKCSAVLLKEVERRFAERDNDGASTINLSPRQAQIIVDCLVQEGHRHAGVFAKLAVLMNP